MGRGMLGLVKSAWRWYRACNRVDNIHEWHPYTPFGAAVWLQDGRLSQPGLPIYRRRVHGRWEFKQDDPDSSIAVAVKGRDSA